MATGISLHIGLNSVNPNHYDGWSGPLTACEADARDMHALAQSKGFKPKSLMTKQATRKAVLGALASAAQALKAGDILFLTYSGHGGQLPDENGDETDDLRDETWCLYDGEIVDDELNNAYCAFKAGVRILVLSDSCHSGTVIKDALVAQTMMSTAKPAARAMPPDKAQSVYYRNQKFYDAILKNKALKTGKPSASVLLISGCQDNQLSADGAFNGLFTGTLKAVWNGGTFKGNYRQFHRAIVKRMPPDQTPRLFRNGASNPEFLDQHPFTVGK